MELSFSQKKKEKKQGYVQPFSRSVFREWGLLEKIMLVNHHYLFLKTICLLRK